MKKFVPALALVGALTLSGCAAQYPATPSTPEVTSTATQHTNADPTQPAGTSSNPILVSSSGDTRIDVDQFGDEVAVTAPANSSFEIVAAEMLNASESSSGVRVEETAHGLLITVLNDREAQFVTALKPDGYQVAITVNGGK